MFFCKLSDKVIRCTRCPRLVAFRKDVPARAAYRNERYWRKPVPGFGDPNSWLLILGMAPSAHGGNRTGRLFTGDESGRFLMAGLFATGFANQPLSESADDGLKLHGCYMTASVKCVPPSNRPLQEERVTCHRYFEAEFFLLRNLKAVLALGQWSFETYLYFLKQRGVETTSVRFAHGSVFSPKGWPKLYASYHPSPQNTYTKKLTHQMFVSLLQRMKKDCA